MALSGHKDFAVAEVLTSADVDNYLMRQAVMSFASTAARDAAIASPEDGMHSFTRDTDLLRRYLTSSWVPQSGQLIAESVLGAEAASVAFSSIPADFTDLLITYQADTDRGGVDASALFMQFNGDTAGNYDESTSDDGGAVTELAAQTAIAIGFLPGATAAANKAGVGNIWVPNYRRTDWHKEALGFSYAHRSTTNVDQVLRIAGGTWRSTAAITSITFTPTANEIQVGSVFRLYGF